MVATLAGPSRTTLEPFGAEMDEFLLPSWKDDSPPYRGKERSGTTRVTAYWAPDIACFDCIQQDNSPKDLCLKSARYWKAEVAFNADAGTEAVNRLLRSSDPAEVAAGIRGLTGPFESAVRRAEFDENRSGDALVEVMRRDFQPDRVSETMRILTFQDPRTNWESHGERFAVAEGRIVGLAGWLIQRATSVRAEKHLRPPEWTEKMTETVFEMRAGWERLKAISEGFANMFEGRMCTYFHIVGYSCEYPAPDIDAEAVGASLAAGRVGREFVHQWPPGKVAGPSADELLKLADTVVASATGRGEKAPPWSWWPSAARLLLATVDAPDSKLRGRGCNAFRAMKLVEQCGAADNAGVLSADRERLKKSVTDTLDR